MIKKKRHGLRFLATIGMFLLFSGGWLIIQLIEESTKSGRLEALDAPNLPPLISSLPGDGKADVNNIPTKEKPQEFEVAKAEEQPAQKVASQSETRNLSSKSLTSKSDKEKSTSGEKPKKEDKIATPKKDVSDANKSLLASNYQKDDKVLHKQTSEPNKVTLQSKVQKKVKRHKTKKEPENVPTMVPPEWNWFSEPLKIDFSNDKIVIFTDFEKTNFYSSQPNKNLGKEEKAPVEVNMKENTMKLHYNNEIIASQTSDSNGELEESQKSSNDMVQVIPFDSAYQKIETRKNKRQENAKKIDMILPSHGGSWVFVPKSLRKLQEAVREIINKRQPLNFLGTIESSQSFNDYSNNTERKSEHEKKETGSELKSRFLFHLDYNK